MALEWTLEREGGDPIHDPSWTDIGHALRELDGNSHTAVSLTSPDGGRLFAGGGNDGLYVVTWFPNSGTSDEWAESDEGWLSLLEPSALPGSNELVISGTISQQECRHCVSLLLVLQVFEAFFRTGKVPAEYAWDDGD